MDPSLAGPLDLGGLVLSPGRTYLVVEEFSDWSGRVHQEGLEFVFLGHSYFPYDAATRLYGARADGEEFTIEVSGHDPEQEQTLGSLARCLRARD